jgi:hypothetical protein
MTEFLLPSMNLQTGVCVPMIALADYQRVAVA